MAKLLSYLFDWYACAVAPTRKQCNLRHSDNCIRTHMNPIIWKVVIGCCGHLTLPARRRKGMAIAIAGSVFDWANYSVFIRRKAPCRRFSDGKSNVFFLLS